MSGDQEPWVFRGGLTADLQVGSNMNAIANAKSSKAQAIGSQRN